MITDDITAWHHLPSCRWMLNKLDVLLKLCVDVGPVGIEPKYFPVIVKPIMNLQGMGLGSYVAWDSSEIVYEPGYMWMPYYIGQHYSYDIEYDQGIKRVYRAKGIGGPHFNLWMVEQVEPDLQLQKLVHELKQIGRLPRYFNIECIDDDLIECHPRWSQEFVEHYDGGPFIQQVNWSDNIDEPVPEGWISCKNEETNHFTKTKKFRIAYKIDRSI